MTEEHEDANDEVIAPGGKVDQQALFDLYAKGQGEGEADDDRPATVRFVLSGRPPPR